ncbi:uncharacterized protein LOC122252716 [Penaeus japonicus]|uniref:uncharacterized protein LOC122252716 n=1 Tax=Penaeus japonicus TaxID=27405 RepID=UPI001C713807|nr:uncharacterized protein LOC122252716 [Penaeus japonicus]
MFSSGSFSFFELLLLWDVLCLAILHADSMQVCQEINVACKTRLPISEAADHVEALVGVRPRQGDWGVVLEVEREKQVVASFSIARNQSKQGDTATYIDVLTIVCGENSPHEVASPWPADWLLGEVKFLLFSMSKDLIKVLWRADSLAFQDLASDVCEINDLSNVSFSASSLPLLPTPTLSIGCTDVEPRKSAETEAGEETQTESTESPVFQLCIIGGIVVIIEVLSVIDFFVILSLRERITQTMIDSGAKDEDDVAVRRGKRPSQL